MRPATNCCSVSPVPDRSTPGAQHQPDWMDKLSGGKNTGKYNVHLVFKWNKKR